MDADRNRRTAARFPQQIIDPPAAIQLTGRAPRFDHHECGPWIALDNDPPIPGSVHEHHEDATDTLPPDEVWQKLDAGEIRE